uniref:Putative secreted protein n=1 Tax=Anopheles triannulatus TaxID=58253 RepID=A0A2M4B769_9DIPT
MPPNGSGTLKRLQISLWGFHIVLVRLILISDCTSPSVVIVFSAIKDEAVTKRSDISPANGRYIRSACINSFSSRSRSHADKFNGCSDSRNCSRVR